MREVWITTDASPTVFRYIDWLITVPLQIIEFYLIFHNVQTFLKYQGDLHVLFRVRSKRILDCSRYWVSFF